MASVLKVARRTGPPARRSRWGWAAVVLATATAVTGRPALAVDADQIQRAIDGGRDYLFAHQSNGNWETVQARDPTVTGGFNVADTQWGGLTALATLALLASGVDANDPHVQQAVTFLRRAELTGFYAIGLRAQVWGLLPPQPWTREAEAADLKLLVRGILTGRDAGPATGLYNYAAGRSVEEADHSVSQFAVLGAWSLAQTGMEVPNGYWQVVDQAWRGGSSWRRAGGATTSRSRPGPRCPAPARWSTPASPSPSRP